MLLLNLSSITIRNRIGLRKTLTFPLIIFLRIKLGAHRIVYRGSRFNHLRASLRGGGRGVYGVVHEVRVHSSRCFGRADGRQMGDHVVAVRGMQRFVIYLTALILKSGRGLK